MLCPSESAFVEKLTRRKVPIDKIVVKAGKTGTIKQKLNGMVFKDPEVKYLAQKAFSSYVRSIYLQKDKDVFSVEELPLEEFADALGLPAVPHVKFVPGSKLKQLKNAPHVIEDSSDDDGGKKEKNKAGKTKHEKMFERRNQTVLSRHYEELHSGGNTAFKIDEPTDKDDDIFTTKRKIDWDATDIPSGKLPVASLPPISSLYRDGTKIFSLQNDNYGSRVQGRN